MSNKRPECNCKVSTGIHEGLTFGKGHLDKYGFWEKPCAVCVRYYELIDNEPVGSYWPFPKEKNENISR